MRASRLLSILILLQLRTRLTAEALAGEFGVSLRTIYRDIDSLSAAGVPVFGDRGPGGGFELHRGYRTQLTGLGADEAEAMLMIGLPGAAQALGLSSAASRARSKLLAALPADRTETAGRIGERFHFDPIDWYRRAEVAPHAPALARAVLDQRMIEMTYESWSGLRDWRAEPLGLVQKAGHWYLVAHAAAKPRIFRQSNIRRLNVLTETFARPKKFDLAGFWGSEMARFETSLRPLRATLRATEAGLKRVARLGAFAADAVAAAEAPDRAGLRKLILPIESIDDAAAIILGCAGEVEALAPAELRARIAELALRTAAGHASLRPAKTGAKTSRASGKKSE
jgi:predicted DNA-binding transcriptional regulator YafY